MPQWKRMRKISPRMPSNGSKSLIKKWRKLELFLLTLMVMGLYHNSSWVSEFIFNNFQRLFKGHCLHFRIHSKVPIIILAFFIFSHYMAARNKRLKMLDMAHAVSSNILLHFCLNSCHVGPIISVVPLPKNTKFSLGSCLNQNQAVGLKQGQNGMAPWVFFVSKFSWETSGFA